MDQRRLVESCALLTLIHVPARPNTVSCSGPLAEVLAADVLRWPDVVTVYLREPPRMLKDKRLVVAAPPVGSCDAVICSPNEDPTLFLHALKRDGVINVSTALVDRVGPLYLGMQQLFRRITPWREWMPEPLYGVLASPGGKVERRRHPPASAKRLSSSYLPCLFTFGKDELSLILPKGAHGQPAQPATARPEPHSAGVGAGCPEFDPRV